MISALPVTKGLREGRSPVLGEDAQLREARVPPACVRVAVKQHILRQVLQFEQFCIGEVGCRVAGEERGAENPGPGGEDAPKSDKGLGGEEEGTGNVTCLFVGAIASPLLLPWVCVQICSKKVSCCGLACAHRQEIALIWQGCD
jgi:hypothetical protein